MSKLLTVEFLGANSREFMRLLLVGLGMAHIARLGGIGVCCTCKP